MREAVILQKKLTFPPQRQPLLKFATLDFYLKIPVKLHWKLYTYNLEIALGWVGKLVKELSGRIVITADHGESFGEKLHPLLPIKIYGHPRGCYIEPLVKVPWLVLE